MNTSFMETVARGLGAIRVGGRAVPGQGRLVDALGRLAGRMGGDSAIAKPLPGVRLETDLTDRIQRQMWAGTYEPHVKACFDALIGPGDVYFDVGGHIGYHAVGAAHRVGPAGRVFAFEAAPKVYERLARNLEQFPWAQATNAAVWDHSGTLTFECSPVATESGWGTLSEVRDSGAGEHIEVRAVSLDDWCSGANLDRWDIMKLDAEGSELAVLRGAANSLEKFQPAMMIEINGVLLKEAGISPMEVVEFLTTRSYRLFSLSIGRLAPWNLAKHGKFSDTLCLNESRTAAALERLRHAGFTLSS